MENDLTFVIDPEAESASLGLLLRSLEDVGRLLRAVDRAVHGSDSRNRWRVRELASGPPTITVRPDPGGRATSEAVRAGLRSVTAGTDSPPAHFPEPALLELRRMRRLFAGRDRARYITVVAGGGRTARIGRDISEQVDRILAAGHQMLGSLDGRIEAISVHGDATVTIRDRVSRWPVRCSIPRDAEWTGRVRGLLGRRVLVAGNVHYFVDGTPRSISGVTDIEDATPDPNLPRAGFGSIPDPQVRRLGAARWLKSARGSG